MLDKLRDRIPRSTASTHGARVEKPVRVKKPAKPPKTNKQAVPELTAPLSELTEGYDEIPVRDMGEWVNRSASMRRQEVEKRGGYVTRPMNSFMLYRSAYAERTKMWCLQNNHQIVSSVSGHSWPRESPEVRERYHHYAKLERENHAKAHPGYKFSPSKANGGSKKKKIEISESESEPSDLEDFDYDWGSTTKRKSKPTQSKRTSKEGSNATRKSKANGDTNRSAYQATNPGKPLPAVIGEAPGLSGHYYQTTIHQNPTMANVEDVRVHMTEAPTGISRDRNALTGVPGGWHPELFQSMSQGGSPAPADDPQVDPFLLTHAGPSSDLHAQLSVSDGSALFPEYHMAQNQQGPFPSLEQGVNPMCITNPGTEDQCYQNEKLQLSRDDFMNDIYPTIGWQVWTTDE